MGLSLGEQSGHIIFLNITPQVTVFDWFEVAECRAESRMFAIRACSADTQVATASGQRASMFIRMGEYKLL